MPQSRINLLLVAEARAGRTVVRLKGGDPFVFGRGSEERDAALAAGIPVTVVPGISSAISVPGAAGIPVTARGVSKSFTVISGHDPFTEAELGHLAGIGGTLVVLMGVATLQQNVAGLLRHGLLPDTPAAIIERGFADTQRSTRATLGTLAAAARAAGCSNPAVIVIGSVAALGAGTDDIAALLPAAAR
ncbi:SAM-dependent methyltransferase [Arthrobacter sp. AQ5-05]|uniref:uroporphyrinogen-III C-methyltransferase n=1 Tax=Arthrobacter sp. AQ5-05 TaxID=2184581 RepID=UPI0025711E92|nr:SAM-dependent methyltransferase [Arthrobacter sp. AQ5-05]